MNRTEDISLILIRSLLSEWITLLSVVVNAFLFKLCTHLVLFLSCCKCSSVMLLCHFSPLRTFALRLLEKLHKTFFLGVLGCKNLFLPCSLIKWWEVRGMCVSVFVSDTLKVCDKTGYVTCSNLTSVEGDLALQGSIGSLSLSDLTAHGEFYRERFTTSGEEALIFQTFK